MTLGNMFHELTTVSFFTDDYYMHGEGATLCPKCEQSIEFENDITRYYCKGCKTHFILGLMEATDDTGNI